MNKKNTEFFKALKKDIHIFKTMNDLEIQNYLHNLLKNIYNGEFAFRKSLSKITQIKRYSIDEAIKNKKLQVHSYNDNLRFEIFSLKDFAALATDSYKNRLRSGRLWVVLF